MANNFEIILDADAFIADAVAGPILEMLQDRPYWGFDDTVSEIVRSKGFVCPDEHTGLGSLNADIYFFMATAATGNVKWLVSVEAVTQGDALLLGSQESFAAQSSEIVAVPAAAGRLGLATVTITDTDAMLSNDYVRLKIARDPSVASDAVGDARLLVVRFREQQ